MRRTTDSEIKWFRKIPSNWDICKVKDGFTRKKAKAYDDNPVVLSLARSGVKIRDISTNEGQLAASYFEYNPVEIDDMLLNPMDLQSGDNCNISKVKGVISPAYINLRYKNGFDPKYYNYFFKYLYWAYVLFAHGKGVSYENRWTLNEDTLMNLPLLVPPYNEQVLISSFLDKRCVEIENICNQLNNQIAILETHKKNLITNAVTKGLRNAELVSSSIPYVNQIPANWKSNKMSRICNVITDYVASGSFKSLADNVRYLDYPDYAMLIRTADVSNKNENIKPVYIDKESYDFLRNSNLFGGEIILPNIGASVGDVYVVPVLYDKMSLAPNSILIKTNQSDKYYYYFFLSSCGRQKLLDISGASAQAKFNKTDLRQMKVPEPPVEEQNEIVSFLDSKCGEIDEIIDKKKAQIKILEEYKKSVIYEYVTGKKEVPNE